MANRTILIIALLVILIIIGCTAHLNKTEQTKELMGSFFTITVYDADKERAGAAIEAAFKEIERIENALSIYKNTSEVYLLNQNGFIENASDDVLYNLERSLYYSNLTNGAFDISVQPILDLYTYTFTELKRPPTDEEIKETKELIGYEKIHIKNKNIKFAQKDMKITLGGIAKGYAVDRAVDVLRANGIEHALVNAGGNMRAIGNKGTDDWSVALENPRNKEEYITIIKLSNNAVSTSGDYERYFEPTKTYHHIINPKTGYSATELISVTIVTNTAMDADALSTSVFVLGTEKGMQLIESQHVEGLIITKEKEIIKSKGFEKNI